MPVSRIRLSFQGIRVQAQIYEPEGDITARALFVSSPMGDPASWSNLLGNLSKNGVLCVSADLPGFGANPVSQKVPQDNDTRTRILWGILDEIEWKRGDGQSKWHLVGHGSGAAAVMTMALYQPDSTLSRVLLSPVLEAGQASPFHSFLTSGAGEPILNGLMRHFFVKEKPFHRLLARLYGSSRSPERTQALYKMLQRKGVIPSLIRHMREGYQLNDDVYSVNTPVMIIWGANDRIFGGQIPIKLAKRLPGAEKHILNTGHMCMETAPGDIGDYLRGWFAFSEGKVKNVVKKNNKKSLEAK
ncbi:MAG: alpha/beta hydrolase [Clostridia bacterium]|nr:alpha/beta hydrolase [Clostridia bacterium]